jgi:hypothetical protein
VVFWAFPRNPFIQWMTCPVRCISDGLVIAMKVIPVHRHLPQTVNTFDFCGSYSLLKSVNSRLLSYEIWLSRAWNMNSNYRWHSRMSQQIFQGSSRPTTWPLEPVRRIWIWNVHSIQFCYLVTGADPQNESSCPQSTLTSTNPFRMKASLLQFNLYSSLNCDGNGITSGK